MFILIGDDYFNTDTIACIRPTSDDQTVIFTAGQSATDGGFLLDMPIDEVFQLVQSARLVELAQMLTDEADQPEPELDIAPESEPD